ncbi:DUF3638 domain-containing protein, partial [bacterium]|nr:DUF3638 domain-containing protein [bacterium]
GERLNFENSFQSLAIQYKSNFRAGLFLMDLGQICDEKKAIFPANYWAEYGRPPKPQAPYAHRITSRTLLDSAAARVRPIPPGPIRLSLTQTIIGILRRFGVESEVAIPVGAKDVDEAVFKEVIDRLSEQFDLDHTDRLVTVLRTVRPKIAFPLVAYRGPDGSLLRERYQRLEASWAAYQDIPIETYALETAKGEEESKKIEVLEQQLILRLDRWSAAAKLLQQWVESVANKLPEDSQGWRFHVDRMRGMGQLSASDTLALLIDQSILDKRNPFLNEIKSLLVTAVTLFAQAQTYYQHLARCASLVRSAKMFADQPEKSKLIVQQIGGVLAEHRVFTAAEDPAALLFELENNLRIRPGQYALAQLMIRGSRQIAQMNMGEGKSTVIMMLIVIGHALKGNLT